MYFYSVDLLKTGSIIIGSSIIFIGIGSSTHFLQPTKYRLGDTYSFGGHTWIIVHQTENTYCLASATIEGTCEGPTVYAGSELQLLAKNFAKRTLITIAEYRIIPIEIFGVTSYIFPPTEAMVRGMWKYFSVQSNRICENQDYWTASQADGYLDDGESHGLPCLVTKDGSVKYISYRSTLGFRPCCIVSIV